ncbi:MAG: hypothetical protein BGP13_17930 [Sphingobacteriales bacterium 40-81]|nr:MAG: hypothetical protein BGP13_17930 [Sphingobacteriales bacterium 40-81]
MGFNHNLARKLIHGTGGIPNCRTAFFSLLRGEGIKRGEQLKLQRKFVMHPAPTASFHFFKLKPGNDENTCYIQSNILYIFLSLMFIVLCNKASP